MCNLKCLILNYSFSQLKTICICNMFSVINLKNYNTYLKFKSKRALIKYIDALKNPLYRNIKPP